MDLPDQKIVKSKLNGTVLGRQLSLKFSNWALSLPMKYGTRTFITCYTLLHVTIKDGSS